MLRSELVIGLSRLDELLASDEVNDNLKIVTEDKNPPFTAMPEILGNLLPLVGTYAELPDATKRIAHLLKIDFLFDLNWWSFVITRGEAKNLSTPIHPTSAMRRLHLAHGLLPGLVEMLAEGRPAADFDSGARRSQDGEGAELLQLIVPEAAGQRSRATRISQAIEAISEIYEAIARLQGEAVDTLTLVACDSGSNKVFDFRGLRGVVAELRTGIVELFDRIHLLRERKDDAELDLVLKRLDIFRKLEAAKAAGEISPEQAAMVERLTISGMTKFVHTGVLTRDITNPRPVDPVTLVKPAEQMLLPAPAAEAAPKKARRKGRKRANETDEDDPD